MRFSKLAVFSVYLTLCISGNCQVLKWEEQFNNRSWSEFVTLAESRYQIRIFYHPDSLKEIVTGNQLNGDFIIVLNDILKSNRLRAFTDSDMNIFITAETDKIQSIPLNFFENNLASAVKGGNNGSNHTVGYMQSSGSVTEERIQIGKFNDNKQSAIISGYVRNAGDNSPIIGVMVRIEGTSSAVLSDVSGFYSLNTKKGDQVLIAGNIETKEKRINLRVLSDGRLDIMLEPRLVTLNAVVISADKEQIVKSTQMGYQRLATKEIKEIPVVFGEQDLIKVSLLLPGIQTVGEGSSGVNVRGSPTDQNLFILNNIPIYNSSHLLGFFSAFNSDAIKDFELYKSSMPPGIGGRLASVFDIRTRQGNQNHFSIQGGISPVTARMTIEGPVKKKAGSFMIAARTTYSDWILGKIDNPDISNSKAGFADAIVNLAFDLNSNNRLNFTSYHSNDQVKLIEQNKYDYDNNGASLTWSHLLRQKNNLSLSLIHSRYRFRERNSEQDISAYRDNFRLDHSEFRAGYVLRPWVKHTISVGLNSVLYLTDQGNFEPLNNDSRVSPLNLEKEKAVESAVYLADDWAVTDRLTLTASVRYNYYVYLGPQALKIYSPGQSRSMQSVSDTLYYGNNEAIAKHQAPDLRFSVRYLVSDNMSLKFSYTQMQQYLFMLTNTIAVSPTDKWKLSDYHVRPMAGNQYSFGMYKTLFQSKLDITAEAYYKEVSNLVEYKNGANLVVNEMPEVDIIQGNLLAYGLEFMISKPKGRLNGWLNYTWSRTLVKVTGHYAEEEINESERFPSNFDKPHALNFVANYKFSRRFSFSSNVVYSTGRPITFPVGFYNHDNIRIPLYSRRNEFRIPDYFRMDMSLKLEGNLASKKFAHGTWILSVYNVTSRKNAYSAFYRYENGTMKGYKLTVFGVPIVSLTYSFKLGNYAD